jgi:hypothetical protein
VLNEDFSNDGLMLRVQDLYPKSLGEYPGTNGSDQVSHGLYGCSEVQNGVVC